MPQTAMVAAWIAGILGGLHCLAMCGAYVTIVQGRATVPLEPRRDVVAGQVAAHAGLVLTYVLLGTLFGAAGGSAFARLRRAPRPAPMPRLCPQTSTCQSCQRV